MSYKDKHLIDDGAPDGLDLDDDPVYQQFLKDQDEARLKQQMRDELNGDIDEYYREA